MIKSVFTGKSLPSSNDPDLVLAIKAFNFDLQQQAQEDRVIKEALDFTTASAINNGLHEASCPMTGHGTGSVLHLQKNGIDVCTKKYSADYRQFNKNSLNIIVFGSKKDRLAASSQIEESHRNRLIRTDLDIWNNLMNFSSGNRLALVHSDDPFVAYLSKGKRLPQEILASLNDNKDEELIRRLRQVFGFFHF